MVYLSHDNHICVPLALVQVLPSGWVVIPPLRLPPPSQRVKISSRSHYVKRRQRINRILELEAEGLKAAAIAERMGLSVSVVRRDSARVRHLARRIKEYWIDHWDEL